MGLDLYNGMPGVVLFLHELARASGEARWDDAASAGARHLEVALERTDPKDLDAGLYTGLAGLAYLFLRLERDGRMSPRGPARRALDALLGRAREAPGGVHWNGSHDIISGNAGIGLLLLRAHQLYGDAECLEAARQAGDRLLAVATSARGGLLWLPGEQVRRNYPNFSHGTAGVAYFLATLFERTREQRFLDGALAGVRYLEAIAVHRGGGTLIHHHDGGGEDLFYLSWCHGPPGTARLFHRLHRVSPDPRWLDWIGRLARATLESGVPEQRTPGFWNNISQCCGNVGLGEYFLDTAGLAPTEPGTALVRRILDDTLRRGTRDAKGLRWVQAEHRVQPENLVAQTGYMQGAAGVGTFLLKLDAFEQGQPWTLWLPDSPFGD